MYAKREVFLLASLIDRIAKQYSKDRAAMRIIWEWLEEHDLSLRFDSFELEEVMSSGQSRARRLGWGQVQALSKAIKEWKDKYARSTVQPVEKNAAALAKSLGLNADDTKLFQTILIFTGLEAFVDLARELSDAVELRAPDLVALYLNQDRTKVSTALEKGPLVEAGLVAQSEDETGAYVPWALRQALNGPVKDVAEVERKLIGVVAEPETSAQDHEHYAKERDFVLALLKGALEDKAKGVNVLIYGATGTGKTEFCRMIANELGASLYGVGETDEDDKEPGREDRVSALLLAQKLIAQRNDAILLFDEMDDLLEDAPSGFNMFMPEMPARSGSKVFLHRMLENNRVATLWTTNNIKHVDDAVLRRMTYALEMRVPPVHVRTKIWLRIGEKQEFSLTEDQAEQLARKYEVSPAVAANAMRAAKLTRGGFEALTKALDGNRRAVYGEQHVPAAAKDPFETELINADVDMTMLADRLCEKDAGKDFSLLLSGPPGTGKTAFVRYLADRMGMEVMQQRASDLISMWVGQSEQQIAEAFKEAADTGRFLVFDEADSMLYDRRNAQRSWEVTQVNEMLTWMESHPLPFACTSNLKEGIDQAAMRRFTFKVAYDYMKPKQMAQAFRQFFDKEAPKKLESLDVLTPGDFAVVRKKLKFLGNDISPDDLVNMLRLECESKTDWKPGGSIGFSKA